MLLPNFSLELPYGDYSQQRLVLMDRTGDYNEFYNPGGYGGPNIARTDVDFIGLSVDLPDGSRNDFTTTYVPTGYEHILDAVAVLPQVASLRKDYATSPASTTPAFVDTFPDGYYRFNYEVYSRKGVPGKRCNYNLKGAFIAGGKIFSQINGGWYDITSEVSVSGSQFEVEYANTNYVYGTWVSRDPQGNLIDSGSARIFNCSLDTGTSTTDQPYRIAALTKTYILSSNTRNKLARMARQFFTDDDIDAYHLNTENKVVLALALLDKLERHPDQREANWIFPSIYEIMPCDLI